MSNKKNSEYTRICIDGKPQGCNNCVAYCSYEEHPGYLTAKHIRQHGCMEKQCIYYTHKFPQERKPNRNLSDKETADFLNELLKSYDGMKITEVKKCSGGIFTAYYVSIAQYPMGKIQQKASSACNAHIIFEKLDYSYENIIKILMK